VLSGWRGLYGLQRWRSPGTRLPSRTNAIPRGALSATPIITYGLIARRSLERPGHLDYLLGDCQEFQIAPVPPHNLYPNGQTLA
jgi:hypothetical protein